MSFPRGMRSATRRQGTPGNVLSYYSSRLPNVNEDCLFLNVVTPQVDLPTRKLLPVIVWFHGGGFLTGSGSGLMYGPDYLVDRDIVFVSLNYRLGILGFLHSNTSDAPGNAGLKDQALALRWVKNNIQAFGGDPKKVTIYGESAGGASVHYQIMSPLSKGLFSGAISSSSAALSGAYSGSADLLGRVTKLFGGPQNASPSDKVKFLRTIPAMVLASFFMEMVSDEDLRQLMPSLPCHAVVEPPHSGEPAFFSEDPRDALVAGRFNKVPLIMGSNFHEGTLYFGVHSQDYTGLMESDLTRLVPGPLYDLMDDSKRQLVGQQIKDVYTEGKPISYDTLPAVVEMFGDQALEHGIHISAAWHSRYAPLYRYHFVLDAYNVLSQFIMLPRHVKGPGHGDDIGYVFDIRVMSENLYGEQWPTASERWLTFITNFCYHRNPTPNATEKTPILWPRMPHDRDVYLEFGDQLNVKQNLYQKRMKFMSKLFAEITPHPVYSVYT